MFNSLKQSGVRDTDLLFEFSIFNLGEMVLKILKRIFLIGLCLAVCLSAFGCSAGKSSLKNISASEPPQFTANNRNTFIHYTSTENLKEIDTSGLITLLFDEKTGSVSVRITNSAESKLWSALPQYTENEVLSDEPAVFSLEVIHDNKKYILNSQDDSVESGAYYWNETQNGFEVTYLITDNAEILKSIDSGATDEAYKAAVNDNILYKVIVTYVLKDGCLYASFDWTNLGNKDDVLVNIGFLEYFGAQSSSQDGDYILVPDGCGAVIDIASAEEVEPVDIAVYGNDISQENTLTSVVAAYGMKSGNDAFVAVIEDGDAFARITAAKHDSQNKFNKVGSKFYITPSETINDKVYFSDFSYDGNLSICFRFLSGANATYAGMAAACREQLVRNFTLSTRSVEVSEYMPVMVNVIGSAASDSSFATRKKLTTFTEAVDILGRMKSKGINNVYLRYSGALSGGMDNPNAVNASPLSTLGGKDELTKLNDYASGLNFKVFVDLALISDNQSSKESVRNVSGKKFNYDNTDYITKAGFPVKSSERYICCIKNLEKTVLSVLNRFDEMDSTGYCLTDVGAHLTTDIAHKISRVDVADEISSKIAPLSTSSAVMINNGNFYSLKNADVVSSLPMSCGRVETDSYISVPFVQLILHGITEYTYDAINIYSDTKTAFLKCIEYGAIPGFVLTNNVLDKDEKYSKIFSVDNWLNSIYDAYSLSGEVLNDLRSSRITNHYLVSSGVYCTEYESTTRIYVNYTNEPVTVSGITVEPLSFFRVN